MTPRTKRRAIIARAKRRVTPRKSKDRSARLAPCRLLSLVLALSPPAEISGTPFRSILPHLECVELLVKTVTLGGYLFELSVLRLGFHDAIGEPMPLVAELRDADLQLDQVAASLLEQLLHFCQFVGLSRQLQLVLSSKCSRILKVCF